MDKNTQQLVENIVSYTHKLVVTLYPNYSFKVGYLTIFSKDDDNYENLRKSLINLGNESSANNGINFTLNKPLSVSNETITIIRIRKPDIHRSEIGCCDLIFDQKKYDQLKLIAIDTGLDVIIRKGYEMIELSSSNIPIYAYIVKDIWSVFLIQNN